MFENEAEKNKGTKSKAEQRNPQQSGANQNRAAGGFVCKVEQSGEFLFRNNQSVQGRAKLSANQGRAKQGKTISRAAAKEFLSRAK